MAKTQAQREKKKRETEKRKKLEKVILKLAADMPDEPVAPRPSTPPAPAKPKG